MRNVFRCTPDGGLDAVYLRTCAIYRLLKNGHIDRDKAIELSFRPMRRGYKQRYNLGATIDIWLAGPLRHRA